MVAAEETLQMAEDDGIQLEPFNLVQVLYVILSVYRV